MTSKNAVAQWPRRRRCWWRRRRSQASRARHALVPAVVARSSPLSHTRRVFVTAVAHASRARPRRRTRVACLLPPSHTRSSPPSHTRHALVPAVAHASRACYCRHALVPAVAHALVPAVAHAPRARHRRHALRARHRRRTRVAHALFSNRSQGKTRFGFADFIKDRDVMCPMQRLERTTGGILALCSDDPKRHKLEYNIDFVRL